MIGEIFLGAAPITIASDRRQKLDLSIGDEV
jgi:hypothetical protein